MKKYILFILILFAFSIVVMCIPHSVFASAGGGDVFGGGPDFGGGSFGGGSGGFFFLPVVVGGGVGNSWWLFLLLFLFVIPFAIRRFGPSGYGNIYRRNFMRDSFIPPADISPIVADDPNFSKEEFLDKVQTYFFSIQEAWSNKNLNTVRAYMSDALYHRLSIQIRDFVSQGITNVIDQVAIGNTQIVRVEKDAQVESITCKIWASMIDYRKEDATGKITLGSQSYPRQFVEYWTFMRSVNTKTKPEDFLKAKICPNCGAPLDINEAGQCKYCRAYIVSGDFDWVLSDISQTFSQV